MTRTGVNHRENARLTVRPLASEDFDGYIAYFTRVSKADAERHGPRNRGSRWKAKKSENCF
jgi:hypothetical protein